MGRAERDRLSFEEIQEFTASCDRRWIPGFEHRRFAEDALRQAYREKLEAKFDRSTSFVARASGGRWSGFLLVAPNAFDSAIFDMEMVQITDLCIAESAPSECEETARQLCKSVIQWAQRRDSCHVAFTLSTNLPHFERIFHALATEGFRYLNTLITFGLWEQPPEQLSQDRGDERISVRAGRESDEEVLAALCRSAFTIDRFGTDPNLRAGRGGRVHETSVRNALHHEFAEVIFVAEWEGDVAGYYTARRVPVGATGEYLGLVMDSAVRPEFRRLGVFRRLDWFILDWFLKTCTAAEMGTYPNNHSVHRVWTSRGLPILRLGHLMSVVAR